MRCERVKSRATSWLVMVSLSRNNSRTFRWRGSSRRSSGDRSAAPADSAARCRTLSKLFATPSQKYSTQGVMSASARPM